MAKQKIQKRRQRRKHVPVQQSTPTSTEMPRSTISRSVKRAQRSLPRSKEQREEVVKKLFVETIQATPRKKRLICRWVDKSEKARKNRFDEGLLTEFLSRPDISFVVAGRNNQVYMGKVDGKSVFAPKHYLMFTLKEILHLAKQDSELSNLSYYRLQQFVYLNKQFILVGHIGAIGCRCPTCENSSLLVEGINKVLPDSSRLPTRPRDIAFFPNLDTFLNGMDLLGGNVEFYRWSKNADTGYDEKCLQEVTWQEAKDLMLSERIPLQEHLTRKQIMSHEYQNQRDNLGPDEIMIHVDFARNYANDQQNAVKSAYFGTKQFSLFTVVIYYKVGEKTEKMSLCYITLVNQHSCENVYLLSNEILKLIEERFSNRTLSFIFWSDGASKEFRSKYAFDLFAHLQPNKTISWYYFEHDHGKGPVDGVGGTVKNTVLRRVLAKEVVIESPQHFASYANSIIENVTVLFVDNVNNDTITFANTCRDEGRSPYIYGTLKIHFVERSYSNETNTLSFYETCEKNNLIKTKSYALKGETPISPASLVSNPTVTSSISVVNQYEIDINEQCYGKFYCVYYDTSYFWGRLIELNTDKNTALINFLRYRCDSFYDFYSQPKEEEVHINFLIVGPCSPTDIIKGKGYNFGENDDLAKLRHKSFLSK